MSKVRPPYAAEFRQQMCEIVRAGRSPAELSRMFDITAQSISKWVGQATIDDGKALPGQEALSTKGEELVGLAGSCARSRWSATSWQRLRSGLPVPAMRLKRSVFELVMASQADLPVHTTCRVFSVFASGRYCVTCFRFTHFSTQSPTR